MTTTLTALITVYHGNEPAQLRAALDSLAQQTRPADEILIVEDGPVGSKVREVVDSFAAAEPTARVLRLPENVGSGTASQAGIDAIQTQFFARLDADDVAFPERFARQLEAFAAQPGLGVVGTAVEEFEHVPGDGGKIRALPEEHEEIARYVKINSPVNNPSVMLRTEDVKRVEGYRDVHFMEDYDLYARLIASGARFTNLPEPLTYFRTSDEQFGRRTGREMFAAEAHMQRNLHSYGLISRPRAVLNFVVRSAYRLLPTGLLRRVYSRLFHR